MRFLLSLLMLFLCFSPAAGQTTWTWTGNGSDDELWDDAGNWVGGGNTGVPAAGDTAIIVTASPIFITSTLYPDTNPLGTLALDNAAEVWVGEYLGAEVTFAVDFIELSDAGAIYTEEGHTLLAGSVTGEGYLTTYGATYVDQMDLIDTYINVASGATLDVFSPAILTGTYIGLSDLAAFSDDLTFLAGGIDINYVDVYDFGILTVGGDLSLDDGLIDIWGENAQVLVSGKTEILGDSYLYVFTDDGDASTSEFETNAFEQSGGFVYAQKGNFKALGEATISGGEFYVGDATEETQGTVEFLDSLGISGDSLVDLQLGTMTVAGPLGIAGNATVQVQDTLSVTNAAGIDVADSAMVKIYSSGQLNTPSYTQTGGSTQVLDGTLNGGTGLLQGGDFVVGESGVNSSAADFDSLEISGSAFVSVDGADAVSDRSVLGVAGSMNLAGGELQIGQAGKVEAAGGLLITSGELTGYGELEGNIDHQGGTIAPGVESNLAEGGEFGTLVVSGDYTVNGGVVKIQIGGLVDSGMYDSVFVDGDVTILPGDGKAMVEVINGFDPSSHPGASWDVITFSGSLLGDESDHQAFLGNLGGTGLRWEFGISGANNTVRLVAVPEPASYAVGGAFLLGMLTVAWRRRRKKRAVAPENSTAT